MGASASNQISQSIKVKLICDTNRLSQQLMEDLILIAGKKKETNPMVEGYVNLCVTCGHLAHGWLVTTCPNEHVSTGRICNACRNHIVEGSHRMCMECNRVVWDWAVKADMERAWWTSWGWDQ